MALTKVITQDKIEIVGEFKAAHDAAAPLGE